MISKLLEAQHSLNQVAEPFSKPVWGIYAIVFVLAFLIAIAEYMRSGLRTT